MTIAKIGDRTATYATDQASTAFALGAGHAIMPPSPWTIDAGMNAATGTFLVDGDSQAEFV